jgi:hypothetical protein
MCSIDFNGSRLLSVAVGRVFEHLGCLFFKPSRATYSLCHLPASAGVTRSEHIRPARYRSTGLHPIRAVHLLFDFIICSMYFVQL